MDDPVFLWSSSVTDATYQSMHCIAYGSIRLIKDVFFDVRYESYDGRATTMEGNGQWLLEETDPGR